MADPPEDEALSEEERRLLEDEMRGVRRIPREGGGIADHRPPPAPTPSRRASPLVVETISGRLSAFDPGVPQRTRRALGRGETPVEASLDLHGLTADDAGREVARFVREASAAGRRCVLVVTGRGRRSGAQGPVVRDRAVQTLAGLPADVLGFVSAPPHLGATGAVLVLLRRPETAEGPGHQ